MVGLDQVFLKLQVLLKQEEAEEAVPGYHMGSSRFRSCKSHIIA